MINAETQYCAFLYYVANMHSEAWRYAHRSCASFMLIPVTQVTVQSFEWPDVASLGGRSEPAMLFLSHRLAITGS